MVGVAVVELGFLEIGIEPIASGQVLGGRDQVDIAQGEQSLDLEVAALRAGVAFAFLTGGRRGCRLGRRTLCRGTFRGFGLEPDDDRVNRVKRLLLKPVHDPRVPFENELSLDDLLVGPEQVLQHHQILPDGGPIGWHVLERAVQLVWNGSGFQQAGAVCKQVRGLHATAAVHHGGVDRPDVSDRLGLAHDRSVGSLGVLLDVVIFLDNDLSSRVAAPVSEVRARGRGDLVQQLVAKNPDSLRRRPEPDRVARGLDALQDQVA